MGDPRVYCHRARTQHGLQVLHARTPPVCACKCTFGLLWVLVFAANTSRAMICTLPSPPGILAADCRMIEWMAWRVRASVRRPAQVSSHLQTCPCTQGQTSPSAALYSLQDPSSRSQGDACVGIPPSWSPSGTTKALPARWENVAVVAVVISHVSLFHLPPL